MSEFWRSCVIGQLQRDSAIGALKLGAPATDDTVIYKGPRPPSDGRTSEATQKPR